MTIPVSIQYIELRPDGFGGLEPAIVGRRISVHDIAAMHVHGNATIAWIAENLNLTPSQIYAALSYYHDHKAEIDRDLDAAAALAHELGTPIEEAIAKMKARQSPE